MTQQKPITGHRKLSDAEVALINEAKALAQTVGEFIERIQMHPATPIDAQPFTSAEGVPSVDKRWVSIGKTHLQQGFMALGRAVGQPGTF